MRTGSTDAQSELIKIHAKPILGKVRLLARWSKFGLRSLRAGNFSFFGNALNAQISLIFFTLRDIVVRRKEVTCNICGWSGHNFYPNLCSGYYHKEVLCPGCDCLDRYRTFAAVLMKRTSFFSLGTYVIEVAPARRFQEYCLKQKNNQNYISFDVQQFAMEKGDITNMRYENNIADYFLCSEVLDYIEDDAAAFREVWRVLKPGGLFIIHVAVDGDMPETREYGASNPKDDYHIRRYGRDLPKRISAFGFEVSTLSATECIGEQEMRKFGLSREPLFIAKKVVH